MWRRRAPIHLDEGLKLRHGEGRACEAHAVNVRISQKIVVEPLEIIDVIALFEPHLPSSSDDGKVARLDRARVVVDADAIAVEGRARVGRLGYPRPVFPFTSPQRRPRASWCMLRTECGHPKLYIPDAPVKVVPQAVAASAVTGHAEVECEGSTHVPCLWSIQWAASAPAHPHRQRPPRCQRPACAEPKRCTTVQPQPTLPAVSACARHRTRTVLHEAVPVGVIVAPVHAVFMRPLEVAWITRLPVARTIKRHAV